MLGRSGAAARTVRVTFKSEKMYKAATGRWYGAFTGAHVDDPGDLDIDRLVHLMNAHESGGWAWDSSRKEEYANYLAGSDHLIAVTRVANRSKGAKGPDQWLPSDENYWCQYATDWTEVKMEWGLTMTQEEIEAIIEMLDTCAEPVRVEVLRLDGSFAPTREPTPTPTSIRDLGEISAVYESCGEAESAGETRVQGDNGEGRGIPSELVPSARDGDGDGVVCEE